MKLEEILTQVREGVRPECKDPFVFLSLMAWCASKREFLEQYDRLKGLCLIIS